MDQSRSIRVRSGTETAVGKIYDGDRKPLQDPSVLYEKMLARFHGLTVRGVIWYQGESNGYFPEQYTTLFPGLIADWRRFFGNDNLPFFRPAPLLPGSGRQERRTLGPPPPGAAQHGPHGSPYSHGRNGRLRQCGEYPP